MDPKHNPEDIQLLHIETQNQANILKKRGGLGLSKHQLKKRAIYRGDMEYLENSLMAIRRDRQEIWEMQRLHTDQPCSNHIEGTGTKIRKAIEQQANFVSRMQDELGMERYKCH